MAQITRVAHEAGALVYVDAVQYAPHGPIDVQALGCDFLACSAYKFFGPHVGVLYGRYDLLEALPGLQGAPGAARPAPGKFETGTGNFEGIAGRAGRAGVPRRGSARPSARKAERYRPGFDGRRLRLKQAMARSAPTRSSWARALLEGLQAIPGLTIYGI